MSSTTNGTTSDTTNGEKWRAAGGDAFPVVLLLSLTAALGRLVRRRTRRA